MFSAENTVWLFPVCFFSRASAPPTALTYSKWLVGLFPQCLLDVRIHN